MKEVRYEELVSTVDPYDVMCGDCVESTIEYYAQTTLEELKEEHELLLIDDKNVLEGIFDGGENWMPTEPDFEKWLEHEMEIGNVRIAE